jgi:hypothetical protein
VTDYREDILDTIAARMKHYPEVGRGMVFGHPSWHVGGRYFCMPFEDGLALKLSRSDFEAILKLPEAEPFAPGGGRAMGTWAVLTYPEAEAYLDNWQWIEKSLAYIKTDEAAPVKKRRKL